MISLRDLTIRYPRAQRSAVENLSLEIGAGEVFGFIGPNGAGKTSTLRVLAGLMSPTSGTAMVSGVDVVKDPSGVRRLVGYMPDFFGVYEDLTCREYLDFFAAAQGLPREKRQAVVPQVLELVDLVPKADELTGSLSRGMQQRLGLARVLVHEPQVLLLDEPASGLDPRARVEIREVLRELGRMGKTVVLSSHVLADLASACTSVGIIEEGRLVYHGSVADALHVAAPGECVVKVAVLEGAEAARAALEDGARIEGAEVSVVDGVVRVSLTVSSHVESAEKERAEAAAMVGARLQAAGLHLTHLEVERGDLERAFMALTEGRLA
jgi:ABC-2 type transport system ATP-binding protein